MREGLLKISADYGALALHLSTVSSRTLLKFSGSIEVTSRPVPEWETSCVTGGRSTRATLRDVARRAEVSMTTASYVLNGRDHEMRLAAATRDRVLRAAAELEYRSPASSRMTSRGPSHPAASRILLVTDVVAVDPYAGGLLQGCFDAAAEHDAVVLLAETGGDSRVVSRVVDLVGRGLIDAAIYATRTTRAVTVPDALSAVPLVLLNCFSPDQAIDAVIPDELEAGRLMAEALLAAGHRDGILLVGGESLEVLAGHDRGAGLRQRLGESGVDLAGVINCDWWPESAELQVGRFLRRHRATLERSTVLVCQNDRIAFGAYLALADLGLRIPADVAVVAFEGTPLCGWMHPTLTSMDVPHLAMGRRAVERVVAPVPSPGTERHSANLRERNSLGAVAVDLAADA